jgi:hypothetical protein
MIIYLLIAIIPVLLVLIIGFIIYFLLPGSKTPDFTKEIIEYADKNGYEYKEDVTEEIRTYMAATDAWGYSGQKGRYALVKEYENMKLTHFLFSSNHGSNSAYYDSEIRYLATLADLDLIQGAIKLEIQFPGDSLAMGPDYDLDFENKKFSNMYLIGANPKKFAYDFFTPRIIEAFLEAEIYRMVVRNRKILIYDKVNLEEWKQVPSLLSEWGETYTPFFEKINELVPGYIRQKKKRAEKDKESPSLELVCPKCESDFTSSPINGQITCPECGAKGTV